MEIGKSMTNIIYAILFGLLISALLVGFRSSALKSSYDSSGAFNVTDSAGVVHQVSASGIGGDTTALVYSLGLGLVWLIVGIFIVFQLVAMMKHNK